MTIYAGIDIGGTKCAVTLGHFTGESINILDKVNFPTPNAADDAIRRRTGSPPAASR